MRYSLVQYTFDYAAPFIIQGDSFQGGNFHWNKASLSTPIHSLYSKGVHKTKEVLHSSSPGEGVLALPSPVLYPATKAFFLPEVQIFFASRFSRSSQPVPQPECVRS